MKGRTGYVVSDDARMTGADVRLSRVCGDGARSVLLDEVLKQHEWIERHKVRGIQGRIRASANRLAVIATAHPIYTLIGRQLYPNEKGRIARLLKRCATRAHSEKHLRILGGIEGGWRHTLRINRLYRKTRAPVKLWIRLDQLKALKVISEDPVRYLDD